MNIPSRKFVPCLQFLAGGTLILLLAACGVAQTASADNPTPMPSPTAIPTHTPTPSVKLTLTNACPDGFGPTPITASGSACARWRGHRSGFTSPFVGAM